MKIKCIISTAVTVAVLAFGSCKQQSRIAAENEIPDTLVSNTDGQGTTLEIILKKGKQHNYPTFAFWIEDMNGNYIQTLYVTRFVATGIYGHGDAGDGEWKRDEGPALRPATLPYWLHKRGIKNPYGSYLPTPEKPVADAYTGATPQNSFILKTKTDKPIQGKFRLMLEINQPWDWNDYWTTNKYPEKDAYNPSAQPSLVYAVTIDPNCNNCEYFLNPIGHGHFAGDDGILYTDIRSFTTALNIVESVRLIKIK